MAKKAAKKTVKAKKPKAKKPKVSKAKAKKPKAPKTKAPKTKAPKAKAFGPTRKIVPADLAEPYPFQYPTLARKATTSHGPKQYSMERILSSVQSPSVRLAISSWLAFEPIDIYPSNGFLVFTAKGAEQFQWGTFRRQYVTAKGDPRDAAAIVTFGCPVGKWAPYVPYKTRTGKQVRGSCAAPMEIHQVSIPWSKVEAGISSQRLAAAPRRPRTKKAVANPLLLTVLDNPRKDLFTRAMQGKTRPPKFSPRPKQHKSKVIRRNAAPLFPYTTAGLRNPSHHGMGMHAPGRGFWRGEIKAKPEVGKYRPKAKAKPRVKAKTKCPYKQGQKIPRVEFEKWLAGCGCPDLKKKYRETMASYKRFHKALPTTIIFELLELGGDQMLAPEVLYSAGKSDVETYTPEKNSAKAPHSYYHDYKDRPEVLINAKGSLVIKPLRKRAKVTDWFYN